MRYDAELRVKNLDKADFANSNVEVYHPDSRNLLLLEDVLTRDHIDFKFKYADKECQEDRIVFKRISWPTLNFYLYLSGLLDIS